MAEILVVDDERDVVTLIRFLLERDGHSVQEAYNGAQALEAVGHTPKKPGTPLPDLVILDVMMPNVDGYTVCRRMAEDPATRGVPLLILTAKGQMKDIFELSPNVAALIEKSFDPKALREMIGSILAKKRGSG